MKHASRTTLAALAAPLHEIRALAELVEKSPGCFYRKGRAYLHFHEDASGLFADVKLDGVAFTRMRVSTAQEQAELVAAVRSNLAPDAPR